MLKKSRSENQSSSFQPLGPSVGSSRGAVAYSSSSISWSQNSSILPDSIHPSNHPSISRCQFLSNCITRSVNKGATRATNNRQQQSSISPAFCQLASKPRMVLIEFFISQSWFIIINKTEPNRAIRLRRRRRGGNEREREIKKERKPPIMLGCFLGEEIEEKERIKTWLVSLHHDRHKQLNGLANEWTELSRAELSWAEIYIIIRRFYLVFFMITQSASTGNLHR